MMAEESKLEEYFSSRAKRIGAVTYKFTSAITGVPDRVLFYKGMSYWVELKAKNGLLSKRQKFVHNEMKSCGIIVFVLWTKEQVDIFIKSFA